MLSWGIFKWLIKFLTSKEFYETIAYLQLWFYTYYIKNIYSQPIW